MWVFSMLWRKNYSQVVFVQIPHIRSLNSVATVKYITVYKICWNPSSSRCRNTSIHWITREWYIMNPRKKFNLNNFPWLWRVSYIVWMLNSELEKCKKKKKTLKIIKQFKASNLILFLKLWFHFLWETSFPVDGITWRNVKYPQ